MSWNLQELCQVTNLASPLVEILLEFTHKTIRVKSGGICVGTINEIFPGDNTRSVLEADKGLWLIEPANRGLSGGCISITSANSTLDLSRVIKKFKEEGVEGEITFSEAANQLCNQLIFIDSCEHWGRIPICRHKLKIFQGGLTFPRREDEWMGVYLNPQSFFFLNKEIFETKQEVQERKKWEEAKEKRRARLQGRNCEYLIRSGMPCTKRAIREVGDKVYCVIHGGAEERKLRNSYTPDDYIITMRTHRKGYAYIPGGRKVVAEISDVTQFEFRGDDSNSIAFFASYTISTEEILIPLTQEDKDWIRSECLNIAAPHVCEALIAKYNSAV